MYKVSFFVPEDHKENVKASMFQAGGGKIGNYDCCSFETPGTGQFRALDGSNPFIGAKGQIETVSEFKVEMCVDDKVLEAVIRAMKKSHPYETPAYDVFKNGPTMKNIAELTEELKAVAKERDWEQFHTPKNLALALGGELGELFELLQWKKDEELLKLHGDEKTKVEHEMADVFIYLVRLASVLEIDLMNVAEEKMRLNKLKYPVEKAKGNAKKYDEL